MQSIDSIETYAYGTSKDLVGDKEARSFKTAICGTFVRRMRKDAKYCFDKNHDKWAWCQN